MREFPEYAGKDLLAGIGIDVPAGGLQADPGAVDIEPPAVIKAQVPVSSRGAKGGIRFADDRAAVAAAVDDLLGSSIDGHTVDNVLVEERVGVDEELYVAFSADGSDDLPTLLLSPDGGEDVESVPDQRLATELVNPLIGFQPYHLQNAAATLNDAGAASVETLPLGDLEKVLTAAWDLFQAQDLRLLEINPMGVREDGPVAMDAKLIADGAATYRQEYPTTHSDLAPLEQAAKDDGIELRLGSGAVGVVSNGAGMGLATLDLLESEPNAGLAAFIDTHGAQFDWEDIQEFLAYLERAGAEVVLVNIIGPFLDCSKIAAELAAAIEGGYEVPIVARFKGLEHQNANEICKRAGIPVETSVTAGVQTAVDRLREVRG